MIDAFVALMTQWGCLGMFLASLLAGSIIPFSSELVLAGLLKLGLDPVLVLLSATAGNTLGGMTAYYLGSLGRMEWIERYLHIKEKNVSRMQIFLQGKGAAMAFFAFLPFVGGVIAVALGFMRSNLPITVVTMTLGKLLRYIILMSALMTIF